MMPPPTITTPARDGMVVSDATGSTGGDIVSRRFSVFNCRSRWPGGNGEHMLTYDD